MIARKGTSFFALYILVALMMASCGGGGGGGGDTQAAPTVSTVAAWSSEGSSATLSGNVTPNGLPTTAWFEWGSDATLTTFSTVPALQSVGSGTTSVPINGALSGLMNGATYYCRVAASNSSGTSKGAILNFTTNMVSKWIQVHGGATEQSGRSARQTSDGGYIIVGHKLFTVGGNSDVYLIKTDTSGNVVWAKTFGGSANDEGFSVQQTSDGGYIIVGSTSSFGAGGSDVYLIKTDASGNAIWTKTFGGTGSDVGFSIQLTSDGGYIIVGRTTSFGSGNGYVYLIKTDASGNAIWTKTFGGNYGYSVQQTSDGGYIIVGYTSGAAKNDVYLIKTDASGNAAWTKTFGGTDDDGGSSVQQTSDGGYIIVGYTYPFGAGYRDVYLIKTDASGNAVWTKTFGGTSAEEGYSVQQTSDGGYVIVGYTTSVGSGNREVYLIKTDGSGNAIWTKIFGGSLSAMGYSVQQTADGGYIIGGITIYEAMKGKVYLIKTDGNGNAP